MTITAQGLAPTQEIAGPPADALRETWESINDHSLLLAAMIERHSQESGEQFDAMVVVPRGSYYPVNIVARELGFGATDLLHACIGSYEAGATSRNGEFKLGQMPTPEQVKGKDVLIIEEVCDTGHTLQYLTALLQLAGAGLVRTGVLHYKPGRSETGFVPDWYVQRTDKWIVYPWEVNEQKGKRSVVKRTLGAAALQPQA